MAEQTETVTCQTEGCPNQGAPIVIAYDDEEGPPFVVCGACGNQITDIQQGG